MTNAKGSVRLKYSRATAVMCCDVLFSTVVSYFCFCITFQSLLAFVKERYRIKTP